MPIRYALALSFACASVSLAQPQVPPGFSIRNISPTLDGQIPQLTAISDPLFGEGVMTATVANGVVTLRIIEPTGFIRPRGVWNEAPLQATVLRVRQDINHQFDGHIHVTVGENGTVRTHYLTVAPPPSQTVTRQWVRSDQVRFDFDFTPGVAGNPDGAVLLDSNAGGGTQLAVMTDDFLVTTIEPNSVPPNRTDTDARGFQRDVTGLYGGGLLLADTDNNDQVSAIYELRDTTTGATYRAIYGPENWSIRRYGDLAIAASGPLGGRIFVTETLNGEVQEVNEHGVHSTWATGFVGVDSLSISPNGESMYVGDLNGVWIIRPAGSDPGPAVLCTDPSVPSGTPLTGLPVASLRLILNEPIEFQNSDISILNGVGQAVPFDASGSGSQFIIVGLGQPLAGDTYTVTVLDSVVSTTSGLPLDGNNDGIAGGDYVFAVTHVNRDADLDADGDVDMVDFQDFQQQFTGPLP